MMYKRTYNLEDYEWDEAKATANLEVHGIDFAEAVAVLEDEFALTVPDLRAVGEDRFVALGADWGGRLLVVVFTCREERLRVISARRATPRERRRYEERR